jgi:hypothetical protein
MAKHASSPQKSKRPTSFRANLLSALAGVLVVVLGVVGVMWLSTPSDTPEEAPSLPVAADEDKPSEAPKERKPTPAAKKATGLIESTTHTRLTDTTPDPDPQARTEGIIVHPRSMITIHQRPNGKAIGKIGPKQIGDTWLPMIAEQDGWVQVLLPSKPNGSTGWLRANQVERNYTPYLITVHLKSMRMELWKADKRGRQPEVIGEWDIGIGAPETPTPAGRTFLLGSMVDPKQDYSPVILPLGAHSDTLDTFGGGPGTVAIHTWPTDDVIGTATSHGCIRVPKDALQQLQDVPLGTLVLVDDK